MPQSNDLVGRRFTRLVVMERVGSRCYGKYSRALWLCKCDCGNLKTLPTNLLTSKRVQSCGCLFKDVSKQNRVKLRSGDNEILLEGEERKKYLSLRSIWSGIIARCYHPLHTEYHRYGGRGISVCDEWREHSRKFIEWGLSNGYELGLTIDRIDNDDNYEPNNCRFISRAENAKKKKTSCYLTVGDKTLTLTEWSIVVGKNKGALGYYKRKYGITKAAEVLECLLKNI